jgi:hypothetical protein
VNVVVICAIIFLAASNLHLSFLQSSAPIDDKTNAYAPARHDGYRENVTKFCVPWEINVDEWWTHHVDWEVTLENDTHFCLERVMPETSAVYLRQAFDTMWKLNCSDVFVWPMIGSGWSADLTHIAEGMVYAIHEGKPFAVAFRRPGAFWHYAALRHANGTNPTCPTRDLNCYFLPLGKCVGRADQIYRYKSKTRYSDFADYADRERLLVSKYIVRPQQWLRKAVYDYHYHHAPTSLPVPCTVMHVRRGDVILHKAHSRRYYSIARYLERLPPHRRQGPILLLTDDANAIDEAHELFPHVEWYYYNRTRFRASSGGWENTAPSLNPKLEVIIILSTLELVKRCDGIVYGTSGFAKALWNAMRGTGDKPVDLYLVDNGRPSRAHGSSSFWSSSRVDELEQELQRLRQGRNGTTSTTSQFYRM